MEQAKRRAPKIGPKAIGGGIFGRFANFDKSRSQVAAAGVVAGPTFVKVGESNRSRDIRLPPFVTNEDNANDASVRRSTLSKIKPPMALGRISQERF